MNASTTQRQSAIGIATGKAQKRNSKRREKGRNGKPEMESLLQLNTESKTGS